MVIYSNEFKLTLTSGLANFLLFPTMVRNDWYTSSSANLSWKQVKFSCSLRIPRSLYESMDRQKARSRHCRSVLRENNKSINQSINQSIKNNVTRRKDRKKERDLRDT